MTTAGIHALRVERELTLTALDRAHGAQDLGLRLADRFGLVVEAFGGERSEDLATVSARALDLVAAAQAPVSGDLLREVDGAGSHPSHLWADGLVHACLVGRVFDLGGDVVEASLGPAVNWLVSCLPQTSNGLLEVLAAPVAIEIGPPTDRTITLWHIGDGVAVGTSRRSAAQAAAHVNAGPVGLLRSCAGRTGWRDEAISIGGDTELAGAVLDRLASPF